MDLINNLAAKHLLDAQDVTTHASFYSAYIDREAGANAPYSDVLFLVNFGTVTNTDANNKVTPSIVVAEDGEDAAASASYAAADSGDLSGSTLAAVLSAATDQLTQKVQYKGSARYVAVLFTVVSAGANPDHIPVSVDAILAPAVLPGASATITTGTIT